MGIKCKTPQQAINSLLRDIPKIFNEEIVRALSYLGEQCVVQIRDRSGDESWYDRTGNLRSSIGYAVYDHGVKCIESAFAVVREGAGGSEAGRNLVNQLASLYARTFALVVVAGMEYADIVEAMESKDVLASAEIWARSKLQDYLDNAIKRAELRITARQHQLGL